MDDEQDYIKINRALWDEKTAHHVKSDFYKTNEFIAGANTLKEPELALLGDVRGKTILHLQCHFGQDTMSLARMGANATGVDFSEAAIAKGRELNEQLGLDTKFICTDIYSLLEVLDEQFDIVFTSYGTIGWLPDMQRWAGVVAKYVKPGGKFIFADFHPIVWMFNNDFSAFQYSYFNREAIVEVLEGTYADRNAAIKKTEIGWNHNLAEVMQGLFDAGLTITSFNELDSSPYNCFSNMVAAGDGNYQIKGMEGKIPMMYTMVAVK
ncbi:MAG: SAM-dependent methyltransferase [Flavipsychrobacter sp.]|nr:SAM-dependent methyltransferase [Flavipsychrobacter sp.]